jgi:hypothetical protein
VDLLGGFPSDLTAEWRCRGTVADLATATAGFRDHFYGLAPHVHEGVPGDSRPWLITAGAIDPAHVRWVSRPTRFAGRTWNCPVVDLSTLDTDDRRLARWVRARLRPSVLVATQTAVLEVVGDPAGRMLPSTPVVSVEPIEPTEPVDVWRLAAVLASPPVSAWMFERRAGSGLTTKVVRATARDVLAVPLPQDHDAWQAGARCLELAQGAADAGDARAWEGALEDAAVAMCRAYGLGGDHPVIEWWRDRRPDWRP